MSMAYIIILFGKSVKYLIIYIKIFYTFIVGRPVLLMHLLFKIDATLRLTKVIVNNPVNNY